MTATLLLALAMAHAREGLWRPLQLPDLAADLKELGLPQDPVALSDTSRGPLGAVVQLSQCTGAFVSADGLIATSYHCVTDGLQFASRRNENLFEDGFHARERRDERWAGPSERVRVVLSVEDATSSVLEGTKKLQGKALLDKLQENTRALVAACEARGDVRCEVAVYDQGAEYELVRMLELRDVRLVYAPPRAVGYFGGEADNWQWPRHSGDFAFVRAYARDGRSSPYSPDNQPYRPAAHLRVAPHGPEPGQPVLVAGFPTETYRWLTAAELESAQDFDYPRQIEMVRDLEVILRSHAAVDPEIAAKVAPRLLDLGNDAQYLEGALRGMRRNDLVSRKWQLERDLQAWVAADPERTRRYGDAISTLHGLEAEAAARAELEMLVDAALEETTLLPAALTLYALAEENQRPDPKRRPGYQNRDRPAIQATMDQKDATWDFRPDRELTRYFLLQLLALPHGGPVTAALRGWLDARQPGQASLEARVDAELERLFANTDLADPMKRRAWMETSAWYLTHSGNPWFELAQVLHPVLRADAEERATREAAIRAVRPGYMAALREFFPSARPRYVAALSELQPGVFYSDANHTLRVSLGKIDGYFPRDAIIAEPRSRLAGIPEKVGPAPFDAPRSLLSAIERGNHGPYAAASLGSVPVCFLSTIDSARGSSGSPTLDAQGAFVGLLFDGNQDSMASDWVFDAQRARSIHTDVGFVLWYLDAVEGAAGLLRELGVEPAITLGAKAGPP